MADKLLPIRMTAATESSNNNIAGRLLSRYISKVGRKKISDDNG